MQSKNLDYRNSKFLVPSPAKIDKKKNLHRNFHMLFNPQAPVAQKIADEVVFRRFQGEGVEFSDF